MKKMYLFSVLALMLIGILGSVTSSNTEGSSTFSDRAATITFTPTSLTGFSYILGCGPSSSQSSNISGSGLGTNNITITPPTEYEISLTGDPNFSAQTTITLTQNGGSVPSTPIYVRLKAGLVAGNYANKNVVAAAGGTNKNLPCSGTVSTPTITVNPNQLTGFTYNQGGGPSLEKTFTIEGSNLAAGITITPPSTGEYEISTVSGGTFTSDPVNPIFLEKETGNLVSQKTIYVRLKAGLSAATYNNILITASSTGAANKTVKCSGTVNQPTLTVNVTTLSGFSYHEGSGPSGEKTFTASGSNLSSDITISAPTDYEVSKNSGSGFSSQITLTQSGGSVSNTTIYVRLKAGLSAANYNSENITVSSNYATTKNVTCSGTVYKAEPSNNVTNSTVSYVTTTQMKLTWTDAAKTTPDGYLIKGSSVGFSSINDPVDGTAESNSALVQNVNQGVSEYTFTGLTENTYYYFKIYPYTNSGTNIDYKTTGASQVSGKTLNSQQLSPGDIAVIGYHSDATAKFAIVLLTSISEWSLVYFTDNGCSNASGTLSTAEGTITWTVPEGGLTRGTIVTFTTGTPWTADKGTTSVSGSFSFEGAGDQVIVYQGSSTSPRYIYALSTTAWLTTGNIAKTTSYCPNGLTNGTNCLTYSADIDNGYFNVNPYINKPAQASIDISTFSKWITNNNTLTFPAWVFNLYDYLNNDPIVENGVTITIQGGNANRGSGNIPEIPNENGNYTGFTFVLNNSITNWTITMQTNAAYGAYYQNGSWHKEIGTGTQIDFSISFSGTKGDTEIAIILGDQDPTLPVVLSAFTVNINSQQGINVIWVTQSETGMNGYYVNRATVNELSQAVRVSSLISATNNSQQQIYVYTDKEIYESGTYYYWLEAQDYDGSIQYYGSVSIIYSLGSHQGTPELPLITEIRSVYPNPFNPTAIISYSLSKPVEVNFTIYNPKGQLVRSFSLGQKDAGNYKVVWDGTDNNDKPCGTGVYYIRMQAGKERFLRKVTLLK